MSTWSAFVVVVVAALVVVVVVVAVAAAGAGWGECRCEGGDDAACAPAVVPPAVVPPAVPLAPPVVVDGGDAWHASVATAAVDASCAVDGGGSAWRGRGLWEGVLPIEGTLVAWAWPCGGVGCRCHPAMIPIEGVAVGTWHAVVVVVAVADGASCLCQPTRIVAVGVVVGAHAVERQIVVALVVVVVVVALLVALLVGRWRWRLRLQPIVVCLGYIDLP